MKFYSTRLGKWVFENMLSSKIRYILIRLSEKYAKNV